MREKLRELRKRLRLPFWHRADIEAEVTSHLEEAVADLSTQGLDKTEAARKAWERFGDLDSLGEALQSIHHGWIGGATVQTRFAKVIVGVVIGLCVIAVLAVPPLRQAMQEVAFRKRSFPMREEVERAARKHPADVYVQLALAENAIAPLRMTPFDSVVKQSYIMEPNADLVFLRGVVSLFPKSPAAHLHLAIRLLDRSGRLEREEEWFGGQRPRFLSLHKRTQEEEELLSEAIKHLREASALAPENSAPDFLLASAFLAKRADEQADEALRDALTKPGWSLYFRETRQALYTLHMESGVSTVMVPTTVLTAYSAATFLLYSRLRSLTRILVGLGENNRQAGRDERAVFYYQSGMHLGHVLLNGADSILDGLVGSAITSMAAGRFTSRGEYQQIMQMNLPIQERVERHAEARSRNFQAYLVSQGHRDLARLYAGDFERAKTFRADAKATMNKILPRTTEVFYSRPVILAIVSWAHLSYVFALLVFAGLLSLISRSWRKKATSPRWRWKEWVVLTIISLAPSYVLAFLAFAEVSQKALRGEEKYPDSLYIGLVIAAAAALCLFLVVPIVGGLLKRRRQPPEERLGRFQAVLASFRTLLLPTFALFLMVALILTIPAQLTLQRWADEEKKIVQQGEVEYWKVGESER